MNTEEYYAPASLVLSLDTVIPVDQLFRDFIYGTAQSKLHAVEKDYFS